DTSGYLQGRLVQDGRLDDEGIEHALREARERLAEKHCPAPEVETLARYTWVARTTQGLVAHPDEQRDTWGDRLDSVLTSRLWGSLFLALVMLLMFNAVFTWAKWPMDGIEALIVGASQRLETALPDGPLRSLLIDGVISGIGAVVVFLPQIFILFLILTS